MTTIYRWIRTRPVATHLLILFFLWLLFFWRYFLPAADGVVFPDGDFTQQFFIFRSVAYQQFASGHFPLWTDCFFGGYPFHADPQSQLFYPPVWINFGILKLLGYSHFPLIALTIEAISHYLAISFFSYFFLREECGNQTGALIGSVVLAYGGYLTGYPPLQTGNLETATWMPLLLLTLRHFALTGSSRSAVATVAIYALAFFAGHPQTFLLITYLSIGYYCFRARNAGRGWIWILRWLLTIFALVTLIVAVQLLPQAQFLSLSTRTHLPFDQLAHGFAPQDIVQFVLTRLGSTELWQPLYVGILGLTLICIAISLRKDATTRFWLAAGLIALLISFGGNVALYQLAHWMMPFFRLFRGQERAAMLVAMAAATLVSLAVDALTGQTRDNQLKTVSVTLRWLRNLTPIAIVLLVLAILLSQHNPVQWGHLPPRFGLLVLGMLLAILALSMHSYKRWFPTALAAVITLELFSANMPTNVSSPFETYPELPMLSVMQSDAASGRWFRVQDDARMQGHWACAYGLKEWGGISPIRLQSWMDFDSHAPEQARFKMLGIDYLISWKMNLATREGIPILAETLYHGSAPQGDAKVYRLPGNAQRAWFPKQVQLAETNQMLWNLMSDENFDVYETAILMPNTQGLDLSSGQVKVLTERPGRIELQVQNQQKGLLVVSEAWYPGWMATTETQHTHTEMVDGYLQGIHLGQAGPQHVVLEYQPATLRWGLMTSILAILLTFALFFSKIKLPE